MGLFAPSWTHANSSDNDDFYARANRFWVGANRDPSNTTTPSPWKGLAHYTPAWSAINSLPFVTHFNTGQGHMFQIDGVSRAATDWSNRGLQEVLPTWRWLMQPLVSSNSDSNSDVGAGLVPELDWTESYYGGTSLKVSGDLDSGTELQLFKTKLDITATTNLQVVYKTGFGGPSNLQIGLAFEDGMGLSNVEFLDAGDSTSTEWNTVDFNLAAHVGETLAVISLAFDAPQPVPNYSIHIGRVGLWDSVSAAPAPPSALTVESKEEPTPTTAALRLRWHPSSDPVVWYNVYQRNPDDSLTHLGSTGTTALFVTGVTRIDNEVMTTIEVEAVGTEYAHSTRSTTSFVWGPGDLFNDGFESGDTSVWTATFP